MNVITYDNENNLKTSVYSIDGLQQASWSYIWGPQGLEYANKNSGALTQNFTTDSRGRILSMTYTSATYSGELYFHYDALGNTSLITDANSNPKASFQYDLHTGRLIQSWNPSNLEVINLNDGITGSINLTAIQAPGMGKDITILPYPPVKIGGSTNGDNWGSVDIAPDGARMVTDLTHVSRFGKDCGVENSHSSSKDDCKGKSEHGYLFGQMSVDIVCVYDGNGELKCYWTINNHAKERLKNEGYSDLLIESAGRQIGGCISKGGSSACFPMKCPNGKCGLECECWVNNKLIYVTQHCEFEK